MIYLLKPDDVSRKLRRKKVRIYDFPDGTIDVRYQGLPLPFSTFDKVRQVKQADVISNKRLGAVLEQCRERQATKRLKRSKKAPVRHAQIAQLKERMLNPVLMSYD